MPLTETILLQNKSDVFVETGTYKGDGILCALKCGFREIHSIEIDRGICEQMWAKFVATPEVHIHCGNSAAVLPILLPTLHGEITVWLDAHGVDQIINFTTAPIVQEMEAIADAVGRGAQIRSVLLDDMCAFCKSEAEWLEKFLRSTLPKAVIGYESVVREHDVLFARLP